MKNSNFKKVLALVLSFAMILSVCLTGFTVSAETAEVDLSYYVINDTTEKVWRNGNQSLALANYDGKTLYRIAPNAVATGQFAMSSKADLTAEQAATVNSLSYYIANETGTALQINYKYYGNNGSDVANFNGYVYLMDANTGELMPLLVEGNYFTVPAGFKGYVVYDLSQSDRYGNSNMTDTDGAAISTVDAVKNNLFKPMHFFPKYTESMITKAWYVGDLAVSTKTVEELAKYISGAKVISYNFNTASVKYFSVDNSVNFWNTNGKFDSDENGTAELVEFGSFEGIGSKFTYAVDPSGGNDGALGLNNAFVESIGTDLPFAMENAKGIAFQVKKEGNIGFMFAVNGNRNALKGTYTLVTDGGIVTTGAKSVPANFSGTAYFIFDELAVAENYSSTGTATWADFIKSRTGDFNLNIYSGDATGAAGDSVTFGGFNFIYDLTNLEALLKTENPVVLDGSETPKRGADSTVGTYSGDYTVEVGDKYAFTFAKEVSKNKRWFYMNGNNAAKIAIADPENVNALSFRAYLPDVGADYTVQLLMSDWDMDYYRGAITAVNYDGTVYTAAAVTTGSNKITLPSGFDGIIIMEVKNAVMTNNWDDSAGTKTYQGFAAYYAATTFCGIQARINAGTAAVNYLELDELRLVYQDIDSYVNDFKNGKQIAEINKTVAEREAANEQAMLEGSHILNTFSGSGNNLVTTSGASSNKNRMIASYVDNDSTDGKAVKLVFNGTDPTVKKGEYHVNMYTDPINIDVSEAAGFSFKAKVTNPDGYDFNPGFHITGGGTYHLLTNYTTYLVSNDGEIISETANKISITSDFEGTVVIVFKSNATVNSIAWSEYFKTNTLKYIRMVAPTVTYDTAEDGTQTLSAAQANFAIEIDDLTMFYDEESFVKKIHERNNTEKYFNSASDISTLGSYSNVTTINSEVAPYDVAVYNVDSLATGSAFKFTRNANDYISGRQLFVGGRSTLTNDEILALDAIAFWVKVPEGQSLGVSRNISCQKANVQSSTMTYDTVKKEFKMVEKGASSNYELSGFEGYVIIPIQNALVATGWENADVVPLTEAFGNNYGEGGNLTKLGGYFYFGNELDDQAQEFWLGSFQTIPSLTQFFAEIGAVTLAGDANNDGYVDIRDTVRLKKYNADAKTAVAYQNMDIDGNGLIEATIDMAASRKQNLGVDYKASELDSSLVELPDVMVGFYHGAYGTWDYYASDIADEADVVNAYTSFDMYSLAQMKQNGGAGWLYLSRSHGGEPVFGTKDGGYDSTATELNEAWKTALDNTVNKYKAQGVWNQVAGFHTEEILMPQKMTNSQYATMTKYLRDTYGKRILAVLSTYEVVGATGYTNSEGTTWDIPAADAATYANVTDIGFNKYHIDTDDEKTSFTNTFNAMKENIGNRTDVKYWLLPTTYCGKSDAGEPTRTDEEIATEIAWFADFFADTTLIPESQRGGILFYTFQTWYNGYDYGTDNGTFGLDLLMRDYDYVLTAQAIADMAAKYVK